MKMKRVSDLEPMLGYPSGICQVVQRIDEKIPESNLENYLINKVENAEDLEIDESSYIYPRIIEQPLEHNKIITVIELSSHAQYRMDLRGITTGDVKVAIRDFIKQFYNEKAQNSSQYLVWETAMRLGRDMVFLDKKIGGLFLAFVVHKGKAVVKTVYFENEKNPRPKTCKKASLRERLSSLKSRLNIL